jgi:hypothetical protein
VRERVLPPGDDELVVRERVFLPGDDESASGGFGDVASTAARLRLLGEFLAVWGCPYMSGELRGRPIYIYIYICMYVYIYMYEYMHVCMNICMHAYYNHSVIMNICMYV